jgi:pimeloyl-ACP methyl ester carboxylesterase
VNSYLLIHGGGSTARFWDRLLPYLDRPALAVDLPGRNGKPADFATLTVADEVESVVADVEDAAQRDPRLAGSVIVVAHSSGGLVVPGVAARLGDRVSGIVLSAGLVPPVGGCGLDCMKPAHRDGLVVAMEEARRQGTVITLPAPPADPESFRRTYGGDPLDDDTLAFVVDPVRSVTDTVNHYFQPVDWSPVAQIPVTYVLNERDRPIPPQMQEEMIARLPRVPTVVRLDCGHVPPVTEPERFAAVLASAASEGELL